MLIITIILILTGTKLKILSDHKGWVNGVAWAKQDPFSDIASNGRGNLASLASDRCLRVYNAGTKNFKNIARTHRCKLRVPSPTAPRAYLSNKLSLLKARQSQFVAIAKACIVNGR